jgi:hypothetical protein
MNSPASFSPAGFMCCDSRGKRNSADRLLERPGFRITCTSPFVMRRNGMSYSRLFREFVDRRFSSGGDFVSPGGPIPCINAAAAL